MFSTLDKSEELYSLADVKKINEETAKQLKRSAWSRVQARVKAQHIKAEYLGIDKNGDVLFRTNSGTTRGKFWYQRIRFKDLEEGLGILMNDPTMTRRDIVDLITSGDIMVDCDDPSFHYFWKYKAWTQGYGIKRETRYPGIRNPYLTGSVCFVGDTLVLTEHGFRPISEIKVGDLVYSHKNNLCQVISTGVREPECLEHVWCGVDCFRVTPEHPFYIERDGEFMWCPVEDLRDGDRALAPYFDEEDKLNYNRVPITHVPCSRLEPVYSLSVSGDSSYLVGRECVAVHNCKHLCSVLAVLPFYVTRIVKDLTDKGFIDRDWARNRRNTMRRRRRAAKRAAAKKEKKG